MSQKLIGIFILCKKELVVNTLSFQIKAIYNFFQKNFNISKVADDTYSFCIIILFQEK